LFGIFIHLGRKMGQWTFNARQNLVAMPKLDKAGI
jgi:hypothetical protein